MIRSVPANATLFFVYEKVMQLLRNRSDHDNDASPAPVTKDGTASSSAPSKDDATLLRRLSYRGVGLAEDKKL